MKSICVFCGSGNGNNPVFADKAAELGKALARNGYNLVYGGSNIGLMGIVSSAARDNGSEVTGIIPERIAGNVPAQKGIVTEIVTDMHQRKKRMYELSDAFISLPGGIGTLEETFEAWTWNQLGYHKKPLALLNINGYFDLLLGFLENTTDKGFLKRSQLNALIVEKTPEEVFKKIENWQHTDELKW